LSGADRAEVKVSPDGRRIGWLAAVHGAPSLWIAQADDVAKSEAVTEEAAGAVRSWWWAYGSDRAVFERGKSGEEHLFVVDLTKKETKDLTPVAGVHATLVGLSPKRPREALIALNDRDRQVEDIQLVDLATGARTPVQQNDGGYAAWWADDDLRVRYAERQNADASVDVVQPRRGKEPAAPLVHVAVEDTRPFGHVGFDKTGVVLYLEDSRGRDTSALVSFDTRTGNEAVLAQDARADVGPVLVHPTTKAVEAASFEYDRRTWTVVDGSVEGDFYYLQTFGGEAPLRVTSRSLDEQRWIIEYEYADGPPAYYRYDRDPDVPGNPGKATFLFNGKDALEHAKLSAMKPVVIKARDGLDLVSYVTLPLAADPRDEGRPKAPLPLVLLVHDGPWSRTTGEDSRQHQWLANRGYAVLSVNFRGSTGFGKRFVEAANLQWGARMQDDLIDAVKWAVDEKIADPAKLAVMGWGYGGYAALVAMTTTPDAFACGVDASGPVNLLAFMQSLPRYLQPRADEFAHRVGDWRTDDGKRLLVDRSPIAHAAMLKHPLLIEQGKIDPRATEADTAQFVEATKTTRGRVTYAVYGEEGQTLARPANRESFDAITEVFLAECLGGPYEPIGSLAGTTLTVPVGAIYVHGLTEAIGSIGAR
jgi:dipeptidyl aminopeptidase/acylaminoacyl peptidase